jgi:hypothetical protein
VNVGVAFTGKTNLDDVSDLGEVHATSCYVRGEEDAGLCEAEIICCPCTLRLGELGVDLIGAEARQRGIALETATELVENRCCQCDFSGAVEVNNGLEWTAFARLSFLLRLQNELVQRRHDVLETGEVDVFLRDTLVRWFFVFIHTLCEVEAGSHGRADKADNLAGNSSGEHEVLAFDFSWVGQEVLNLVNLLGEPVVHQAIGLVHDQCTQFGGLDARVWI